MGFSWGYDGIAVGVGWYRPSSWLSGLTKLTICLMCAMFEGYLHIRGWVSNSND